jgi:hypothetical protein
MDRRRYPPDWPQISRRIRERDKWRCRWCGARNGEPHPDTGSRVVLTVAHLNHEPSDCGEANLLSLCPRCHLEYDRPMHIQHARETRWRKKHTAMGMLPFGDALPGISPSPSTAERGHVSGAGKPRPRRSKAGGKAGAKKIAGRR